jgi:homoserine dehydrogenase
VRAIVRPHGSGPPPGVPERRRPHGGAPIQIGLLGCGIVGGGVVSLLTQRAAAFQARVGVPLSIRRVLVRDLGKPRVGDVPRELLTTDADAVLSDPEIDIFVEVMGGETFAGEAVLRALESDRCVVTANKALLAKRGPELLSIALARKVDLSFEAAVGGGIPIVRTLRDAFASDEVTDLVGILNGTSNYILTRMVEEGASFDAALAEAQQKGFAEADPSLDIDGHDAAQKLLVLSMLAFGIAPPEGGILVEGIRGLDPVDVKMADRFGLTPKHLVVGRDHGAAVELRAHPALLKKSSVFSNVSGSLNAVELEGRALGPCLLSGRGAGDMPTAVSVVADILDVARNLVAGVPGLATSGRALAARPLVRSDETRLRYYLRLTVRDEPGVMAKIAGALGAEGVSLSQIVQTEGAGGFADVVLLTHVAREGSVKAALGAIGAPGLPATGFLAKPPVLLRLEDV